jgi:hypothetical protein
VTAAVALAYQSRNYPAVHRRRKLKGWASTWMSHDGFHEKTEAKRQFSGVAQMVGFGLRRKKGFIFQWELTDTLSARSY